MAGSSVVWNMATVVNWLIKETMKDTTELPKKDDIMLVQPEVGKKPAIAVTTEAVIVDNNVKALQPLAVRSGIICDAAVVASLSLLIFPAPTQVIRGA